MKQVELQLAGVALSSICQELDELHRIPLPLDSQPVSPVDQQALRKIKTGVYPSQVPIRLISRAGIYESVVRAATSIEQFLLVAIKNRFETTGLEKKELRKLIRENQVDPVVEAFVHWANLESTLTNAVELATDHFGYDQTIAEFLLSSLLAARTTSNIPIVLMPVDSDPVRHWCAMVKRLIAGVGLSGDLQSLGEITQLGHEITEIKLEISVLHSELSLYRRIESKYATEFFELLCELNELARRLRDLLRGAQGVSEEDAARFYNDHVSHFLIDDVETLAANRLLAHTLEISSSQLDKVAHIYYLARGKAHPDRGIGFTPSQNEQRRKYWDALKGVRPVELAHHPEVIECVEGVLIALERMELNKGIDLAEADLLSDNPHAELAHLREVRLGLIQDREMLKRIKDDDKARFERFQSALSNPDAETERLQFEVNDLSSQIVDLEKQRSGGIDA